MSADIEQVCSGWWNKWQEWGVACPWANTLYSKCVLIYLVCFSAWLSVCVCVVSGLALLKYSLVYSPLCKFYPQHQKRCRILSHHLKLTQRRQQWSPCWDFIVNSIQPWTRLCGYAVLRLWLDTLFLSLSLFIWLPSVCLSRLCRFIVNQSYLLAALAKDPWLSVRSS